MIESLYILILFNKDCGIPCEGFEPMKETMTFAQCRHMREPMMWHYRMVGKEYWAVCRRIEE